MRTIKELGPLSGKTVFLRLDLNVPVADGKITDDYRIRQALPTVHELRLKGAKIVIASHIETPTNPTLEPVHEYLKEHFPGILFIADYFPQDISGNLASLPEGGIILLENVRRYPEEKGNSDEFARHLASFAHLYVNDAFATAHRKHASVVGVPKFIPGYAGLLMENEVKNLSAAFAPPRPFVFVLGGAKFETKLPLVRKFLGLADTVIVGGALANDLYKARGYEVGRSLLSESFAAEDILGSEKLMLPRDVVVTSTSGNRTCGADQVKVGDMIVDAGPQSLGDMEQKISEARFVLWNGPLGNFENGFRDGTDRLAKIIAESHGRGLLSVVGGGDTLAAISSLSLDDKFSFISTGGGAMLDYLANGTLPALDALEQEGE